MTDFCEVRISHILTVPSCEPLNKLYSSYGRQQMEFTVLLCSSNCLSIVYHHHRVFPCLFHICSKIQKIEKANDFSFSFLATEKISKCYNKNTKIYVQRKASKQQNQDKQTYKKFSLTQSYTMTRVNIPQNDLSIRRCRRNQMRTRF